MYSSLGREEIHWPQINAKFKTSRESIDIFDFQSEMRLSQTKWMITEAAERFETGWGEGGGLIFHLAVLIPLLKFSKLPFAPFVGTSNLHGV